MDGHGVQQREQLQMAAATGLGVHIESLLVPCEGRPHVASLGTFDAVLVARLEATGC